MGPCSSDMTQTWFSDASKRLVCITYLQQATSTLTSEAEPRVPAFRPEKEGAAARQKEPGLRFRCVRPRKPWLPPLQDVCTRGTKLNRRGEPRTAVDAALWHPDARSIPAAGSGACRPLAQSCFLGGRAGRERTVACSDHWPL